MAEKVYVLRAVRDTKAEGRVYDVQLWEGTSAYQAVQVASRVVRGWDVQRIMLALVADRGQECAGPFPYLDEPLPDGVSSDVICVFVPKSFAKAVESAPTEDPFFFVGEKSFEPEIEEIISFDLIEE